MSIYKAKIDTPFGHFLVAAKSTEHDARQDILSAARSEFNCHPALVKIIGNVTKSNAHLLKKMWALKHCRLSSDGYWAFIRKI